MVIGWLYLFGGLSGGRRIVAAKAVPVRFESGGFPKTYR
jgi:hypothetical protein